MISITQTMCMNVAGLTGVTLIASGFRYISQLFNRLKNLSRPAAIGTNPNSRRSAHQVVFSRLSVFCILPPASIEWFAGSWLQLWASKSLSNVCNLFCGSALYSIGTQYEPSYSRSNEHHGDATG